jgi:NTP pyrophosphatase (non-canonical NTP hydrolase)
MTERLSVQGAVHARLKLERLKADIKWSRDSGNRGTWLKDPDHGYVILGEEFGEVGRAILEHDYENLEDELYDVAQVATAWAEAFEAQRRTRLSIQELKGF